MEKTAKNDTKDVTPRYILDVAVYASEGSIIFLLNFLTLVVFASSKRLRTRRVHLLMSLVFADCLVGITAIGYAVIVARKKATRAFVNGSIQLSKFTQFDSFTAFASMLGLVLVSVDCFGAMVFPLWHRNAQRILFYTGVALQWGVAGVQATSVLVLGYNYHLLASCLTLAALLVICFCYTSIFIRVRSQNRLHQRGGIPVVQRRERELAKTLFIVTVLSLLTWLPAGLLISPRLTNYSVSTARKILLGFTASRFLNSLVNPIVYVLRMRDFRRACVKLLLRVSPRDKRGCGFELHPGTHTSNGSVARLEGVGSAIYQAASRASSTGGRV